MIGVVSNSLLKIKEEVVPDNREPFETWLQGYK